MQCEHLIPSKHVAFIQCFFNAGPAWDSVEEGGTTLKPHRVNAPCLLGDCRPYSIRVH